jgi:cell wall-associated NlpC family hydrolase
LRLPAVRRVLIALAAATCVVTLLPTSGQADPTPTIKQAVAQLDRLENAAEVAAENYDAAQIRVATAEQAYSRVQAKAASAQARFVALSKSIGSLVSTLYRTDVGGSSLALLSASNPQAFLAQTSAVDSLTRQRAEVLGRVETARQEVISDQLAAKQKLALVKAARADAAKAKSSINKKVKAESHLLKSLKAAERRAVLAAQAAEAEQRAQRAAQAQRSSRSVAPDPPSPPVNVGHASGRAEGAVEFAIRQLHKRYVYAASGPDAYDCSGLTMAAYRSVGVYLPHQSSQQYHYGRHVSSSDLEPGDLVFYYSPIHHVGIYIGHGMIINAANPSEGVTEVGVFSMPYVGAVRVV